MKLSSSIPTLLLGIAAGVTALNHNLALNHTVALNQTTHLNQTAAINLATLNWPQVEVHPTYHQWYDDKLQDAVQCLAEWCESDHYIRRRGGKVRCRSRGDYGAEVFICNEHGRQRCSATTLSKALSELREKGTSTGAVKYETAEGSGFLYGFEYFCKGNGEAKCAYYDAVDAHCNREKDQWGTQRLQYDGVAKKRRVENFKYLGTTWVEKPTPKPEAPVHEWSTQRTNGVPNGAPEPTPSINAIFQPAPAYTSKAKPQPQKTHGPVSKAIVPSATGVAKA